MATFVAAHESASGEAVWKLKKSKRDENDIVVFDLEIEWAWNANTSNGLE